MLHLTDVETPVPQDNELLVEVYATSVKTVFGAKTIHHDLCGGGGTFAVQLARAFGTTVTGVDCRGRRF